VSVCWIMASPQVNDLDDSIVVPMHICAWIIVGSPERCGSYFPIAGRSRFFRFPPSNFVCTCTWLCVGQHIVSFQTIVGWYVLRPQALMRCHREIITEPSVWWLCVCVHYMQIALNYSWAGWMENIIRGPYHHPRTLSTNRNVGKSKDDSLRHIATAHYYV
jgi:hypothetical protein